MVKLDTVKCLKFLNVIQTLPYIDKYIQSVNDTCSFLLRTLKHLFINHHYNKELYFL